MKLNGLAAPVATGYCQITGCCEVATSFGPTRPLPTPSASVCRVSYGVFSQGGNIRSHSIRLIGGLVIVNEQGANTGYRGASRTRVSCVIGSDEVISGARPSVMLYNSIEQPMAEVRLGEFRRSG